MSIRGIHPYKTVFHGSQPQTTITCYGYIHNNEMWIHGEWYLMILESDWVYPAYSITI